MSISRPGGRGLFITLEGVDGVGKTTQIERLAAHLRARGRRVLVTEEPGGTPLGAALDALLKQPGEHAPTARAEALLFLAARAQHVETLLQPALAAGSVVLCSRFSHSTLAYQCAGLGLDETAVRAADAFSRAGLEPDLVLLFDADPAAVSARREGRPADPDRIEARGDDYQSRVREGFRELARQEPERIRLVPAAGSVDEVQAALRAAVEPWL